MLMKGFLFMQGYLFIMHAMCTYTSAVPVVIKCRKNLALFHTQKLACFIFIPAP